MLRLIAVVAFIALALALAGAAHAKEAPAAAADPQLEKRALVVAEELRCLVCQNQTLTEAEHARVRVTDRRRHEMSVFWLIAGLMLACALAFVLVPLMRKRRADAAVTRDAINISVYRDQLRELDADLQAGTLTPGRHEEAIREIERRLLEDTRGSPDGTRPHAGGRGMAMAVGIALPVLAASLYLLVGTPQALAPGASGLRIVVSEVAK